MKKNWFVFPLILMALAFLVACGAPAPTEPDEPDTVAAVDDDKKAPEPDGKKPETVAAVEGEKKAPEPEGKKPGIKKPGIKKPGIKKPGIKKPGIKKPGIKKPGIKKPDALKEAIKEAEKKAEEKKAGLVIPGMPEIDPSMFPPPRPALETAPDLSDATLVITDGGLTSMASDAVPQSILDKIKLLRGRRFSNAKEFVDAIKSVTKGDEADPYMDRILRNSLSITMASEASTPEGEVMVVERDEPEPPVVKAAAMAQPVSEPSPEFQVVYFDFDKSNIKPEFEAVIRENSRQLLDNPNMSVTIEGHADERGTNEYNLALGMRRAQAVRRSLIAEGVSETQLQTVTYGEERPVDLGHDENAWAKNRRGVIVIN